MATAMALQGAEGDGDATGQPAVMALQRDGGDGDGAAMGR